jgi:hypothetical protein
MKIIEAGKGIFDETSFKSLIIEAPQDIVIVENRYKLERKFSVIFDAVAKAYQEAKNHELKMYLFYFLEDTAKKLCDDHAARSAPYFC